MEMGGLAVVNRTGGQVCPAGILVPSEQVMYAAVGGS